MKSLEKFKEESLEIHEQLATQGGVTKNNNSNEMANSAATSITSTHPDGKYVNIT